MEQISNQRFDDFPAANLYLDDLISIANLVKSVSEEIILEGGGYKTNDINEIPVIAEKSTGDTIASFKITGHSPYISIQVECYGISVYISESSTVLLGTLTQVRQIVSARKKIKPSDLLTWLMWIFFAIAVFLAYKEKILAAGLIVISTIFGSMPFIKPAVYRTVIIYSKFRKDAPNFLQRKKDDLILAGASALLGAVFGAAATHFVAVLQK